MFIEKDEEEIRYVNADEDEAHAVRGADLQRVRQPDVGALKQGLPDHGRGDGVFDIGRARLQRIIQLPGVDFVVMSGKKKLIARERVRDYILAGNDINP